MNARFDYTELQDVSFDLIAEFGRPFIMEVEGGDYDPITGDPVPPGETIQVEVWGVIDAPTSQYAVSVGQDNIEVGDMLIYFQPLVPIALDAVIIIEGARWQVVNVQTIMPASTPLLYIVQIRR
jgi:hypothetical protein